MGCASNEANINKQDEKIEADDEKTNIEIIVYVSGEVLKPDVYHLTDGCRVIDAIEKAGGFKEEANKESLNLARKLKDGEQIMIPKIGDDRLLEKKVNINTANIEELTKLRGIGKSKAEAIINYREKNGRFTEVEELRNIRGLKGSNFENIKDLVTVD